MINRFLSANYIWRLKNKIANCDNQILRKIYLLRYRHIMLLLGSYISELTQFSDMPIFPHGINGILISEGAKIGKGCTIFHQVTIGSNTLSDTKKTGSPIIGNNVYIGCGAKIIGGCSVGNNVRIGANCIVTDDIPDNSTVVMEKPRIIIYDQERDNSYKKYSCFKRENRR